MQIKLTTQPRSCLSEISYFLPQDQTKSGRSFCERLTTEFQIVIDTSATDLATARVGGSKLAFISSCCACRSGGCGRCAFTTAIAGYTVTLTTTTVLATARAGTFEIAKRSNCCACRSGGCGSYDCCREGRSERICCHGVLCLSCRYLFNGRGVCNLLSSKREWLHYSCGRGGDRYSALDAGTCGRFSGSWDSGNSGGEWRFHNYRRFGRCVAFGDPQFEIIGRKQDDVYSFGFGFNDCSIAYPFSIRSYTNRSLYLRNIGDSRVTLLLCGRSCLR
jgi:hypothetical protein